MSSYFRFMPLVNMALRVISLVLLSVFAATIGMTEVPHPATDVAVAAYNGNTSSDPVVFVGPVLPSIDELINAHRVVSVGIENGERHTELSKALPFEKSRQIPTDALWPDSDGSIHPSAAAVAKSKSNSQRRNPWETVGRKTVKAQASFRWDAVIIGGDNAIGVLNGRIVKEGDSLDGFKIEGVYPEGVVVELKTEKYVITRDRRITITSAND
jgi:hypothetical protein